MTYPDEVLTVSKKGKTEVRRLVDRGRYMRYEYLNLETGERSENKVKLVLIKDGGTEEFFIIPVKGSKYLLIPAESKGERMVWDGEKCVPLDIG